MKRLLRAITLLGLMALMAQESLAQVSVSGRVTDASGEALVGVTVLEQGTRNGTSTDIDGRFSMGLTTENPVLSFSFIGYRTENVEVNARSEIQVTLQEDIEQLQEIVVTALGFEEDKDKLGYASSTVDNSTIVKSAETSLLNALSGKSSGLRVSRNSGDPGAGAYLQIRGISTITRDAQPLIVLDGVPISNDTRGNGDGRIAQQSRLNDINPNDIESITVLKGASAAALWGTKALGGVIVITTKGGKYNQPLQVSYKGTYSIDQINRRYPMQTKYGQGNNGVWNARSRDSWGDKIADRSGEPDAVNTNGAFFLDQDGKAWYPVLQKNSRETFVDSNFDQVFQNGHFFENNLSFSGGNSKSTSFFSISDMNQEGIIRNNSDYRRTTVRYNGESQLADKFRVNFNSTYTRSSSNRIRRGASSSGLYLGLARTPPDFDNSGYRGSYYSSPTASPVLNRHRSYREPLAADGTATYNNPEWTINEQENFAIVNRFINTAKLTYSPAPWIDLIGRVGLDFYGEDRQEFYTPGSAAGEYINGLFSSETAINTILNMDYIAKANKSVGDNLDITALVGFNYNARQLTVDGTEIRNFIQFTDVASPTRDIDNALPENRTVSSTYGSERTAGAYTSLTLDAWNMLSVNATLRGESASTFGRTGDNTFYFPSVSVAWQFTEMLELAPLSFGKLRASYGEVGVQPARYNTSNVFVAPTFSDEYGGSLSLGLYGNGGLVPSTNRGNENLRPERKKEFEIGTDLRFINDKVSLSATYFDNVTSDVLLEFPIANSRGYDQIYSNGAEISNKGVEVDLGFQLIEKSDLSLSANFIYTRVRNLVTDLAGVETINLGGLAAVNSRAIENQPLGVLWGSRTLRDESGNIVYDAFGFPEQDIREGVIGDPNPDWQGSIFTNLRYKNLTLSVLFETLQGGDIYAGTKSVMSNLGVWESTGNETSFDQNLLDFNGNVIPAGTSFRGSVTDFGAGPVALTEAWYLADGGFFGNGNDEIYIEDGSWSRIRELTLSYSLNPQWVKGLGLKSADVSFTGRNLFLWTAFEGNDPDTSLTGVSVARGLEYFNNPGTKSYVFSLMLNF